MKKAESLQDFLTSEGYIKVQMKRSVAGHFEIDAEVERIAAFLLLVDTGAGKTVLHTETAELLGIAWRILLKVVEEAGQRGPP
ncbi:MAG: hypothetical protein E2O76_03765 [Caldithrix sp.]|nr:MAG: hypothetical protein E2O76_03765 [Caldithrix sp.]